MSTGQVHLFAADGDLLGVLQGFEKSRPVQYVLGGSFPSPVPESVRESALIPGLGTATGDQESACRMFLILDAAAEVTPREIRQSNGIIRFAFDQLLNPDSVVLWPGGVWKREAVISGSVGTASDSSESVWLLRQLRNGIRRGFVKVRGIHVGPRALEYMRSGYRLTHAVQSPRDYDLREDDAKESAPDGE